MSIIHILSDHGMVEAKYIYVHIWEQKQKMLETCMIIQYALN